jgi:hypothetical protein
MSTQPSASSTAELQPQLTQKGANHLLSISAKDLATGARANLNASILSAVCEAFKHLRNVALTTKPSMSLGDDSSETAINGLSRYLILMQDISWAWTKCQEAYDHEVAGALLSKQLCLHTARVRLDALKRSLAARTDLTLPIIVSLRSAVQGCYVAGMRHIPPDGWMWRMAELTVQGDSSGEFSTTISVMGSRSRDDAVCLERSVDDPPLRSTCWSMIKSFHLDSLPDPSSEAFPSHLRSETQPLRDSISGQLRTLSQDSGIDRSLSTVGIDWLCFRSIITD